MKLKSFVPESRIVTSVEDPEELTRVFNSIEDVESEYYTVLDSPHHSSSSFGSDSHESKVKSKMD